MNPLLSLYKRALKLVLLKKTSLLEAVYTELNILSLHQRLKYNKGVMMFKIMTGTVPSYLKDKKKP